MIRIRQRRVLHTSLSFRISLFVYPLAMQSVDWSSAGRLKNPVDCQTVKRWLVGLFVETDSISRAKSLRWSVRWRLLATLCLEVILPLPVPLTIVSQI